MRLSNHAIKRCYERNIPVRYIPKIIKVGAVRDTSRPWVKRYETVDYGVVMILGADLVKTVYRRSN